MESSLTNDAAEPVRALNRVRVVECGEPLVDLRKHCPGVRVSRKCLPYLRLGAADMLNRAQAALPPGYRLWVRTALRTLEIQRECYERHFREIQEAHPDWRYASLRRAANRFFAPVDQKFVPGHCTGGAVDVHLLAPGGHPTDLTSPLDGWAAAPTEAAGLSPRARRNRALLRQTMASAGFSNCRDEFWHYSYGDAAWAVRTGVNACFYGLAEAP